MDKIIFYIENNFTNDEIINSINELYKLADTVDIFYKKRKPLFELILYNSKDINKKYDLCKILLKK